MHPRIRFILIHLAATLGGALIGAGAGWVVRRWVLPDFFADLRQYPSYLAMATILINAIPSVPAAVLVMRFVLRQKGDVTASILLGEFFGPLLAISLGYLGYFALLIPPLIGASLLTMTARGPGNNQGWGANLINSLNQRQ